MKTLQYIILLTLLSFTPRLAAQFNGEWQLNLRANGLDQKMNLSQEGNTVRGSIKGEKLTGTWNPTTLKLKGYFRYKKKIHKFEGTFKNRNKQQVFIGKYCACSGTPDKSMTLIKQKEYTTAHWRAADDKINNQSMGTTMVTTRRGGLNSNAVSGTTKRDFAGRYRITITRLYTNTKDRHALGIFDETSEMYGTIGIRMNGVSQSGAVTLKPAQGKPPRVWNVSSSNPVKVKQTSLKRYGDATGKVFQAAGVYEIDKMREFMVQGEIANSNLIVNIQADLSEADATKDDTLGWKQRSLYVKDMNLGSEYLLNIENGSNKASVGFILEKI